MNPLEAAEREIVCGACAAGQGLDFEFSFAFQPIVDTKARCVQSYEALVRGPAGEPADWVLGQINESNRYPFDQACRVKALRLATQLGVDTNININFMPNAMYKPELCIRTTVRAARQFNFPIERIIFEATEGEKVIDHRRLVNIVNEYKRLGLKTAIDDFGAGFAGLNLLAEFQPNFIKMDMALVRGVDTLPARQAIVQSVIALGRGLDIAIVAEGVETLLEYQWLAGAGISLYQGFLFAKPAFESLPKPAFA